MDDLLVGFACGVGFSNDGWFLEKTEESHVSNVIDLLINLAFFVYFGAIIPWGQFNSPEIIGLTPWRLVVLGILVLFFRRIPIMLMLKPFIPDIKTWREASFAGHFGPIGVGGLFVAILARAELETESTTPLAVLPEEGFEHLNIIEMIWPITCFLVIVSILVHGSSIAVFTLGKRINTLTISLSYTQANEDGPTWMDRLPRIQSRSRTSMSGRRPSESSFGDEKAEMAGPGLLPPAGYAGQFLRRQREEDNPSRSNSRQPRNRKKWDGARGPGGPISQSAIGPVRRDDEKVEAISPQQDTDTFADAMAVSSDSSSSGKEKMKRREPEEEIFEEGDKTIYEDKEGNVLRVEDSHGAQGEQRRKHELEEGAELIAEENVQHGIAQKEHGGKAEEAPAKAADAVQHPHKTWRQRMQSFSGRHHEDEAQRPKTEKPAHKRGPALAYQFGNTIIVEDEDGEVIKKYDIPAQPKNKRPEPQRHASMAEGTSRAIQSLKRMGTQLGIPHHEESATGTQGADGKKKKNAEEEDDEGLRFTVTAGGRRMSKAEFIQQMSQMDPKARAKFVQSSDAPAAVKTAAHEDAKEHKDSERRAAALKANVPPVVGEEGEAEIHKVENPTAEDSDRPRGPEGLTLVDSNNEEVPFHSVHQDLSKYSMNQGQSETAAQRRRRLAAQQAEPAPHQSKDVSADSDDETPAERRRRLAALQGSSSPPTSPQRRPIQPAQSEDAGGFDGETAAERKRRLGALGVGGDDSPESDSDNEETGDPLATGRHTSSQNKQNLNAPSAASRAPGIRFAEQPRIPTKDERMAEEKAEKEEVKRSSAGRGVSKLWKK